MRAPEQPVYECDRCNAYYAREKQQADAGHPYDADAAVVTCTRRTTRLFQRSALDLCGACVTDFEAFMMAKR